VNAIVRGGSAVKADYDPNRGLGMATVTLASPQTASMRLVGDTDQDLIARVRAGEDRAFALLYERYHRRIAAYIYGMVKDYGRAEDIAQDVFMSALRRIRDTDRAIAFKPWIYEIAKNACIDQFRRSQRAEEVSYDADDGLAAADYGRLVTTGPAPDVAVDQKQSLDHLCGAFVGLSETHHEILVMREFEGLSYREIGERLGMSRPSVESTLFRARRRLAEEYEELVSGARCLRVQAIISGAQASVLGTRDRRRLAAHVSHCQPCRRHAHVAQIDPALLVANKAARTKIAALLPLPAFLRRRGSTPDPTAAAPGHSLVAQWSTQLSTFGDPAVAGWAKAVAAAATIAVAGIGASVTSTHPQSLQRAHAKPAPVRSAGARRAARPAPAAARTVTRAHVTSTQALPASTKTAKHTTAMQAGGAATPASAPLAASQSQISSAPPAPGESLQRPLNETGVPPLLPSAAPSTSADAKPAARPVERALQAVDAVVQSSERSARAQLDPVVTAATDTGAAAVDNLTKIVHGG
jgi:RNA polymerase sigma factor (sigma-70 family)